MSSLLDTDEVLRYLGYRGQVIDGALRDLIGEVSARAERGLRPRGVRGTYPVTMGDEGDGLPFVAVEGTALRLRGRDITAHLAGARACVLLACTLGMESEREARRLAVSSPLEAVIYDAACSALIEAAVDGMQVEAVDEAARSGLHAGNRFSPGYGDLPLSAQASLLEVLGAQKRIGLTVTDGFALIPTKSVTAVIGLFERPRIDEGGGCDACSMGGSCRLRHRDGGCGAPVDAAEGRSTGSAAMRENR